MSAENETHAAVVAEMRKSENEATCPWWADGGGCDHCPMGGAGKNCPFDKFADRAEAAHKREIEKLNSVIQATVSRSDAEIERLRREVAELRKQIGNAAKLREAVVLALSLLDLKEGVPYKTVSQKDIDFMKAALAEPSRNCDLYNDVEDSWQDYKQFRRQIGEAIYFDMVHFWPFAKWLFATATEHKGEVDTTKARRHDERR